MNYVRMLPDKLVTKLVDLGFSSSLCHWIRVFLFNHLHMVRLGLYTSFILTLSIGVPQGCVLSPLYYALYTYDCTPTYSTNTIIHHQHNLHAHRDEIQRPIDRCGVNNPKYQKKGDHHRLTHQCTCVTIAYQETCVVRVPAFKFLGTYITEHLSWAENTSAVAKKRHSNSTFSGFLGKNICMRTW